MQVQNNELCGSSSTSVRSRAPLAGIHLSELAGLQLEGKEEKAIKLSQLKGVAEVG